MYDYWSKFMAKNKALMIYIIKFFYRNTHK